MDPDGRKFRRALRAWYAKNARTLPWRATHDPYRILVSEVMLQQTRVAAVIPYYERFLQRFPTAEALARAPERQVLAMWAGLGYYSRARNLQKAAREIAALHRFPDDFESIRRLPGAGDYTAAAVASIAFGLAHAAVDGNVLRVMSRVTNERGDIRSTAARNRLREASVLLLDRRDPGGHNQAMMELGAVICLPREPRCDACPVARFCEARRVGCERELPVKLRRGETVREERTLLLIERRGAILLWQRPPDARRLAGFWELPEAGQLPRASISGDAGVFRHSITNHNYVFHVVLAKLRRVPRGFFWVPRTGLANLPLSTTGRKALAVTQV